MEKKYKLTEESIIYFGKTLFRIEALKDFGNVNKGDKGGYVQSDENLSQEGDCWISDNNSSLLHGKSFSTLIHWFVSANFAPSRNTGASFPKPSAFFCIFSCSVILNYFNIIQRNHSLLFLQ